MKYVTFRLLLIPLIMGSVMLGCNKDDDEEEETDTETETGEVDVSILKNSFYADAVSWSQDESTITISTTDVPDHKSMYFETSNALYEAYSEPNNPDFFKNPNRIESQNYTFKIPRYPSATSSNESTGYDAIGVTVNGIVFFNQNAAPGDDILEELNTFDQYEGHPQQQGVYHHHTEPVYLTETLGDDALMGILLDGFPVYGPVENGVRLTNADLDEFHGHTGATAEFPDGIYHYHITDELPWINGGEYKGTAGTVSQ